MYKKPATTNISLTILNTKLDVYNYDDFRHK